MASPKGDHDRVVMASRKPDGTPDQTEDFTFIGDKEFAKAATAEQLKQQRVSAADVEIRGATGADGGRGEPDAFVKPIADAHEKAAKGAESDAASEVDSRFEDVSARRASGEETTAARPASENTARK